MILFGINGKRTPVCIHYSKQAQTTPHHKFGGRITENVSGEGGLLSSGIKGKNALLSERKETHVHADVQVSKHCINKRRTENKRRLIKKCKYKRMHQIQ